MDKKNTFECSIILEATMAVNEMKFKIKIHE